MGVCCRGVVDMMKIILWFIAYLIFVTILSMEIAYFVVGL